MKYKRITYCQSRHDSDKTMFVQPINWCETNQEYLQGFKTDIHSHFIGS